MLIDDIKITVEAGKGGNGLVGFSKVKFAKGPTGGNGGRGGNIFIEGVADLTALKQFRFKKDITAKNGENGRQGPRDGANAKDLTLFVPTGTVCHNLAGPKGYPKDIEITKIGERQLVVKGGRGGKGNWFFRSSTNTTPKQSEPGEPGQHFNLRLELKIIADIGFVGLPNVGKSSLLNELTQAKAKVANYPFTTLEPNLGVYYDLILADIPGLISGASLGKGLGTKFLRHIERTKVLFHLVSAESPAPIEDYKTVRKELESYSQSLLKKPEYIFITKSDIVEKDTILKIKNSFRQIDKKAEEISILNQDSINTVKAILNNLMSAKKVYGKIN